MNIELAMKWARETVIATAARADAGDQVAKLQLDLIALSYMTGWLNRDNAIKQQQIKTLERSA